MRFLALTAFQSAALALATTAVILALYFLKHRRRRLVISSALLWKRVLANRLENSLFERLRRILSILVAVIIGLLVAMSIARPEIDWLTGKTSRTIIVMDTSPSMQARMSDGRTRWQHAVDAAKNLVNQGSVRNQFRIVDTAGRFDSAFTTDRTELRRMIEGLHPVNSPTRFPRTEASSANSKSQDAPQIYLITDGVSTLGVPAGVTSISEFQAASNVGITAFEVRSIPSSVLAYEAFLEVTNFGKASRFVDITVSGAGQQRMTRNVKIEPGKSYSEAMDVSKFDGGGIRASVVSDSDAFSPDDVAYAYLPIKRRSKTLLVTSGNKFLESALKLDSRIDLTVTNPAGYTGTGDYDAYVFDRFAPPQQPARPALFINPWGASAAQNISWLPKQTGSVLKPTFESRMDSHPVMKHVVLNDVTIENAARIDPMNLTVLATSAMNTPLIVASERPQWIMLTFDLDSSDFPYHAGFPVFIDNAMSWFGRDRLALRKMPGIVDVPMTGAQIRTIDGQTVLSRESLNGTVFEAPDPGLYVASQGDASQYVAVNFTNRQYSDINSSHVRDGKTSQAASPLLRRELWFYMLCIAMILIGAEWFTYHRRITL
jgi:Ca-activated chloride channel homolog